MLHILRPTARHYKQSYIQTQQNDDAASNSSSSTHTHWGASSMQAAKRIRRRKLSRASIGDGPEAGKRCEADEVRTVSDASKKHECERTDDNASRKTTSGRKTLDPATILRDVTQHTELLHTANNSLDHQTALLRDPGIQPRSPEGQNNTLAPQSSTRATQSIYDGTVPEPSKGGPLLDDPKADTHCRQPTSTRALGTTSGRQSPEATPPADSTVPLGSLPSET